MPENIDIKDLYKRLPFLEKTIREEDRKVIEVYVIEKVGIVNEDTTCFPQFKTNGQEMPQPHTTDQPTRKRHRTQTVPGQTRNNIMKYSNHLSLPQQNDRKTRKDTMN